MALTKVSTDGVKDDAITKTKIPANQIEASELADNAVDTNAIADQAVALSKLPHGTSSNNGKFLRANNGADPTFETVNTDLVSDTSPQLGGTLDSNGNVISLGDATGVNSNRIKLGAGNDFHIYHNGTNSTIREEGDGDLLLHTNNGSAIKLTSGSDENMVVANKDGAVDLYHNNNKRIETTDNGALVQTNGDAYLTILADNDNNNSNNWPLIDFRINNLSGTTEARIAYREDNSVLKFDIAGSEKVGINANGLVFNGDTAAANALDDYEEGTFTPTQPTIGFNSATGHYTKIGRQVTVSIFCTLPTNSSGQAFVIDSMPFTSKSNSGTYIQGGYVMYTQYTAQALKVLIHDNSTRMQVYSGAGTDIALTNLDNQNFRIQLHYTVS